jgi:hypothetical protein
VRYARRLAAAFKDHFRKVAHIFVIRWLGRWDNTNNNTLQPSEELKVITATMFSCSNPMKLLHVMRRSSAVWTELKRNATTRRRDDDFKATRVFAQGFPPGTSWQDLKDHFRVAGEVVYASVSFDNETGQTKGHGIVQFETADMAQNAIQVMRNHPLNGATLFVREDVQEQRRGPSSFSSEKFTGRREERGQGPGGRGERGQGFGGRGERGREDNVQEQRRGPYNSDKFSGRGGGQGFGGMPTMKWSCGNDKTAANISDEAKSQIFSLIRARDDARKSKNYEISDVLRDKLKDEYGVFLNDRLKLWWTTLDTSKVPQSIEEINNQETWRHIPTIPENDACVNPEMVQGLLRQRDVARRARDFKTADALLEQARTSPDGELTLRIHDDSRTWRIWSDDPPPRQGS